MIELNVLDNTAVAMEVAENDLVDLLVDMSVVGGGGIVPSGTKSISITANGTYTEDVTSYASAEIEVDVEGQTINNQNKSVTPSESTQSVTADAGYTGLGTVTVDAIDSEYVGSDVPRNDSSDLTASGATVNVPSGYYASNASKAVASGSEGTPTASKGAVSNHSVSVTPSVTNTAGYIAGGTHSGTAVTVSASELVSGTKTISDNGTGIDVTEYASVDVDVQGGGGISVDDIAMNNITGNIALTVNEVKPYAFYGCQNINVSAPNVTVIGTHAFDQSGTSTFNLPNVITINANAFSGVTNDIYLPQCTTANGSQTSIGDRGRYLALPKLTSAITTDQFRTLYSTIVDLGYTPSIGTRGLYQGQSKTVIVLRKTDAVVTLTSGALTVASGCRVYVPSALISSYQSATNWSSYTTLVFESLEDSIYESETWPED